MRQIETFAIAASLILTITAASYAQERLPELPKPTVGPASDIAALASHYFDANWTLGVNAGSSQPTADDNMVNRASEYLDENWRVTRESSIPENVDSESMTNYFDANWAIFGRK